jgi:hypothetical protein
MNRLYTILSAALLSILLIASGALAIDFNGTSSGTFINPVGPSGMVTTGVGTSAFTWGTGVNSPPSSLGFTGGTFTGFYDQEFSFGTLTYFNGTIASGSEANAVTLDALLTFTLPSGITQNFNFPLGLINTPNTTDPNASADYQDVEKLFI